MESARTVGVALRLMLITSVDKESPEDPPSHGKPHRSKASPQTRWRPKTWRDRDVDPS